MTVINKDSSQNGGNLVTFSELRGRVGIFGGSFDPVTKAHVAIAERVREAHKLDSVVFVPTATSAFKLSGAFASGVHRLAMLQIALHSHPGLVISDFETRNGGTSYTVDTVRAVVSAAGLSKDSLCLVVGADCLPGLPQWKEWKELVQLVTLVVVGRAGIGVSFSDLPVKQDLTALLGVDVMIGVERNFVSGIEQPISATGAREALARGDIAAEIDPGVLKYCQDNNLYRGVIQR